MKLTIKNDYLRLVEMCEELESQVIRDAGFVCKITNLDESKFIEISNDNYPLWTLAFVVPNADYNRSYVGNNIIDTLENKGALFGKEVLNKRINDFFFDDFVPFAFSVFSPDYFEFRRPAFFDAVNGVKENESQVLADNLNIENIGGGIWVFFNNRNTIHLYLEIDENQELLVSIQNFRKSLIQRV
ncbi:hypothetical protein [Paenibacillus polymyxa]|uniref:hypothetical protein n=1 Tax=Paenibacillus polymyxa TaxID=1406 RepID=UPI00234B3136|nr:hypothetical protein [Paenibacillus polymyxa]WCM59995.1 hypothetical protein OYT09_18585 [Paenibacillus polymyxa]